jgi:hypothetical protein
VTSTTVLTKSSLSKQKMYTERYNNVTQALRHNQNKFMKQINLKQHDDYKFSTYTTSAKIVKEVCKEKCHY